MARRSVISIGNFDGVHRGHATLLARAGDIARAQGPDVEVQAWAFDPHPASSLRPGKEPPRLTTWTQRQRLLREAGASGVVRLVPDDELLSLSPEAFIDRILSETEPVAIVEGPDFRFGSGRAGDLELMRGLLEPRGIETVCIEPVECDLSDQTIVRASSTVVRWLVSNARVHDAARVLGRPYAAHGTVQRGDRRGRVIGYPTANLRTDCLVPRDSIYAGVGRLADGREFPAAIHVGERATFDDTRRTIEAYLVGWDGPLAEDADEYGWELELRFVRWIRDQARFETVDALVEQIDMDVARCLEALRDAGEHAGPAGVMEGAAR